MNTNLLKIQEIKQRIDALEIEKNIIDEKLKQKNNLKLKLKKRKIETKINNLEDILDTYLNVILREDIKGQGFKIVNKKPINNNVKRRINKKDNRR